MGHRTPAHHTGRPASGISMTTRDGSGAPGGASKSTRLWVAIAAGAVAIIGYQWYQSISVKQTATDVVSGVGDGVKGIIKDTLPPTTTTGGLADTIIGATSEVIRQGGSLANDVAQLTVGLTIPERRSLGFQVHQQIRETPTYRFVDDRAKIARLERLAQPYLDARQITKDLDYTFYVLDDPVPNAFSHIGGYIYVHTGLLDLIENDEQLAFVIGHEIGHVERGHTAHGMTITTRAGELVGGSGLAAQLTESLAGMVYRQIACGYQEDLELEADWWSQDCALRHGGDCRPAIRFFEIMDHVYRQNAAPQGSSVPAREEAAKTLVRKLKEHYRTHPPPQDRIRELKGHAGCR